jgi:hypothetical protein
LPVRLPVGSVEQASEIPVAPTIVPEVTTDSLAVRSDVTLPKSPSAAP